MLSNRHCAFPLLLRNGLFKKLNKVLAEGTSVEASRSISTSAICLQQTINYYKTLGISSNSTQTDIKAAYYKLSKQFHPDKNLGCEESAKKFRDITQAYEVLGNYKLRRLYDKGIIHTAGSQYAHQAPTYEEDIAPEIEDDPQTKFYKSRFKKSQVANAEGRTPIYDFDAWSRAHYGSSFERKRSAKEKYDRNQAQKISDISSLQNEILMFGTVFVAIAVYYLFYWESSYDTPRNRRIKEQETKDT